MAENNQDAADVLETARQLSRRTLHLAFVWNDLNFRDAAHVMARTEATKAGIADIGAANVYLDKLDDAISSIRRDAPREGASVPEGPESAAEWLGADAIASRDWMAGWDACRNRAATLRDYFLADRAPREGGEADPAEMLCELLARIHRDGGHYVYAHGVKKAVADADLIIANLYAAHRPRPAGGDPADPRDDSDRYCDHCPAVEAFAERPQPAGIDARAREYAESDHVDFDTLPEQHKDEYRALACQNESMPSDAPERDAVGAMRRLRDLALEDLAATSDAELLREVREHILDRMIGALTEALHYHEAGKPEMLLETAKWVVADLRRACAAALNSRPVVDEAMVERFCQSYYNTPEDQSWPDEFSATSQRAVRAATARALAAALSRTQEDDRG